MGEGGLLREDGVDVGVPVGVDERIPVLRPSGYVDVHGYVHEDEYVHGAGFAGAGDA